MQYIVFHLSSRKDLAKVIKTFKALDHNGDGHISREEFAESYAKTMKGTPEQVELEVDRIW